MEQDPPRVTGAMRHAQRTLPEDPLSPELIARLREAQAHQFPADYTPQPSSRPG